MSEIVLVSKEGTKFNTSSQFSVLSGLVHNVLEDYHENEDISVPFVTTVNLERILEFANHHNFIVPQPPKRPVASPNFRDSIPDPWDAEFVGRFNEEQLIEIILAANYLDMKCLMDICLVKIACTFKDKDIEAVRKEYGIIEEFTPEIEEKLKTDYPWALEADAEEQ
ncbi:hypothetical protein SteCoe_14555 [Stentor coeruleus]|uniref:SKP1-like protein n=1 Tax=Stentor coeruleus TaxID=5963 RepID=A0A1R2C5T1_9CILI|nr:hypothetical protein SteCoe_14555 [Stentor coeruleus]